MRLIWQLYHYSVNESDAEVDPEGKAKELTGEKLLTLIELVPS